VAMPLAFAFNVDAVERAATVSASGLGVDQPLTDALWCSLVLSRLQVGAP